MGLDVSWPKKNKDKIRKKGGAGASLFGLSVLVFGAKAHDALTNFIRVSVCLAQS